MDMTNGLNFAQDAEIRWMERVIQVKYHNTVAVVSNYATESLNDMLNRYGQLGYQLVNAVMAKNKHSCEVMYLFFTKKLIDKENEHNG